MSPPTIDRRAAGSSGPGLHALVVGVSAYPDLPPADGPAGPTGVPPTFGLKQLSRAATSAFRIFEWLLDTDVVGHLPVPLATCRLLLAPAAGAEAAELAEATGARGAAPGAADPDAFRAAVAGWRADAASHPDNVTVFYFAGHGMQRSDADCVLLLPGFGRALRPVFSAAVALNELLDGMLPDATRPKLAATQIYLIDACRSPADPVVASTAGAGAGTEGADTAGALRTLALWDETPERTSVPDTRNRAIVFATYPRAPAVMIPGEQTAFSKALLTCLGNRAGVAHSSAFDSNGDARWCVSTGALFNALPHFLKEVTAPHAVDQMADFWAGDPTIVLKWLDGPPEVDVRVTVDPSTAHPCTYLDVRDQAGVVRRQYPPRRYPQFLPDRLHAGAYTIEVRIDPATPPFRCGRRHVSANCPAAQWLIRP